MKMVGVLAVAALAGSAMGADVKFYNTDGNGNNNDGFIADLAANGYNNPTGDYTTFCVEVLEHFSYGSVYSYQISTEVKNNGSGNQTTDFTTLAGSRVAYIYKTFRAGGAAAIRALSVDDGDNVRDADEFWDFTDVEIRELIQRFIWDRFAYPYDDNYASGIFSDTRFTKMEDLADDGGAAANVLFGVRIMNTYDGGGNGAQDMLTMIPLPSSAAMAFVGLGGLGVIRRRRA